MAASRPISSGLLSVTPISASSVRNAEFLAKAEHPVEHAIDTGLRQVEHASDHLHAIGNRLRLWTITYGVMIAFVSP